MASSNSNLSKARKEKNDEFYTQLSDIENELKHYKEHLKGKVILCNCDNPERSNFWKYFYLNFIGIGLKKLIATHLDREKHVYKMEYAGVGEPVITDLVGDGDFRSPECTNILKEADIVVTNPPFSLFREYVAQLVEYDKKFLILGNVNAVTYKEIFPLIKHNKLWFGPSISSGDRKFCVPDSYPLEAAGCGIDENGQRFIRVKGVRWFTNLDHSKRHEELLLSKTYNSEDFHMYDNYAVINVDKTANIPVNYDGVMGVPITFLDKYCPEQFEIVSLRKGELGKDLVFTGEDEQEFNRTFLSMYNEYCSTGNECRVKELESYLGLYHEKKLNGIEIEPIDLVYPNATNLQNGLVNDCKINGKKTYVRVLCRKRSVKGDADAERSNDTGDERDVQ